MVSISQKSDISDIIFLDVFNSNLMILDKKTAMYKRNQEAKALKEEKAYAKMEIINFHAAGIDVGSRSHYVSRGEKQEEVREFGVYNRDLHELCRYL
jgi:O-glycosyl hydrolase